MLPLRVASIAFLATLSTLLHCLPLFAVALVKAVLPFERVRLACNPWLTGIAESWIAVNSAMMAHLTRTRFHAEGGADLHVDGHYLVLANHQSWVDILVLQRIFHRRVPFLKFFLKQELIWVPVIGLAWWALDFPFMKRGKGLGSQRSDLRTTRQACEKFKLIPTTVINFVEGTRFTPAKHAAQASPWKHLLKPKIGGLSIALAAMGEMFEAVLDVTIVYPGGRPTFWDLLCGRVDAVVVRVQQLPIPAEVLGGDPVADADYRRRIGAWVQQQWADKDRLIDELTAGAAAGG